MMGESRGLPPEHFFRAMPSRTSENALLEHGVNPVITIDIYPKIKN